MYSNQDAIEMYNQMTAMGPYYSSGRPVVVDTEIILSDICSKLGFSTDDVVLDVGCGTGLLTIPISRRCKEVYAIDGGERVLDAARQRVADEGVVNVTYCNALANRLPFADNKFDHVLVYAVIHYLENDEQIRQCFAEFARVCKPGGKILIADIPDANSKREFELREKTPDEQRLTDIFTTERGEYDIRFRENVAVRPAPNGLVLDCILLSSLAVSLGCEAQILRQDIRQPFSLTRRDLLLTKGIRTEIAGRSS